MMIRKIRKDELEKLLDLYTYLHKADFALPGRAPLKRVWEEICADPKIHYFVAEKDSRLVSCCHMVLVPNLTRGARPYALIENVVTHGDHRRQGYGTRVLQRALEWAWEQGCYKVMLLTGRKAEEIDTFYASAGFDGKAKRAYIAKNPVFG